MPYPLDTVHEGSSLTRPGGRRPQTRRRRAPPQAIAPEARIDAKAALVLEYLRTAAVLPAALIRPSRAEALSRLVASSGPWLTRDQLALVTDVCLFVFAVDDLVDESGLPEEELAPRLAQYEACAVGEYCPEIAFDPIGRCLLSIAARLRSAPLGEALWGEWASRVHEILSSMLAERRASALIAAGGAGPDLARHLETGRHTISVGLVSMAAWMTIGHRSAIEELPALVEAEYQLAIAARIANDLRSKERERGEGTVNAALLVGPAGEPALRAMLDQHLRRGRELLVLSPAGSAPPARFLEGFATFLVTLYSTRDFHAGQAHAPFGQEVECARSSGATARAASMPEGHQ